MPINNTRAAARITRLRLGGVDMIPPGGCTLTSIQALRFPDMPHALYRWLDHAVSLCPQGDDRSAPLACRDAITLGSGHVRSERHESYEQCAFARLSDDMQTDRWERFEERIHASKGRTRVMNGEE